MVMFPKPYTVKTKSAGQYIAGKWVDGTTNPKTISANVQPLNAEEAQALNIGTAGTGKIKIFTDEVLKRTDKGTNTTGDVLVFNNRNYEVIDGNYYNSGLIPHWEYIGELR